MFFGVLFVVLIALMFIYRALVKESCSCIRDPGGKEEKRKKKNKDGTYDLVSETSTDDENYVPPTLVEKEEIDPAFQIVDSNTSSPYSAFSAYEETASVDHSYSTEQGMGRVLLTVMYHAYDSLLKVNLIEVDGLPSKEQGGAANYRIHLALLPHRNLRFKSKTRSRFMQKFEETFNFKPVLKKDLVNLALRFRLYGISTTGNKLIAETFFQLADIAKLDKQMMEKTWRAFRAVQKPGKKR